MSRYRKFIVALAGLVLIFLNDFLNFGVDSAAYNENVEGMINAVIGLVVALGVYQVRNEA